LALVAGGGFEAVNGRRLGEFAPDSPLEEDGFERREWRAEKNQQTPSHQQAAGQPIAQGRLARRQTPLRHPARNRTPERTGPSASSFSAADEQVIAQLKARLRGQKRESDD
jgi:hypothetical protein